MIGADRPGVLFRAAAPSAADPKAIAALDAVFGLDDRGTLSYDDARRGVGRRVRLHEGRIEAVRLAGDTAAEPWLRELFDRQDAVTNLGAALLAPTLRHAAQARGKVVCSCWNVAQHEICSFVNARAAADANLLDALQAELKCGTQCGSCLPELRRLVSAGKRAA